MKHLTLYLAVAVLLLSSSLSQAAHPIVEWILNGDLPALRDAAVRMSGTPEGKLAAALADEDAAVAIPAYRSLVDDASLANELKAIAWYRLYGYAVVVHDIQLADDAARWLNDHPDESAPLFHGDLPAAASTHFWTVQIGAFSSRANADRLAADQRSQGYTVQVDPIVVNNQTLYAVRVGRFNDHADAEIFARRVFGSGGYRVVESE